ncbi:predicted protein [Chaetomium globosum CBS 148.51]|uniref:Uncharacterized protein n=1 Tax=Chaetomium globosum (strain ATCC 6205 / CBS 148.51 / DSM 1962 / NBRC 6347 / NRRL 1970) TaxID=306901 RepID=Q2H404_CHAGB|nr:uncharacterized protein CHGG_06611 [Chaetomium globosum CBS 148.51]EAQ89992.1 predicted protein [Chaetomium globosum CBS 148.51]
MLRRREEVGTVGWFHGKNPANMVWYTEVPAPGRKCRGFHDSPIIGSAWTRIPASGQGVWLRGSAGLCTCPGAPVFRSGRSGGGAGVN